MKTIAEINERIRQGQAVVATAEEIIDIVKEKGISRAAREVDVVTTGTFGPMCSSGAYLNTGHTQPRIKLGGGRVYLNDVPAYTGFAAVDPSAFLCSQRPAHAPPLRGLELSKPGGTFRLS
jgi:uncharacterized protein (DUF39 family)